ncbi:MULTISPECIES: hypothetical protein [Photorhabdus]|uniref:Uncharacterized protein n=1 Tax=Photorhabdus kayaii TaxID=230088 RepID=A0ABX0AVR7_9GAMM|nr:MULTISPECIES: hypothetical protein [Photorhabdus]MCC8376533.1 hypothetical protein [Photorhabdus bodei]MCT8350312.1 hypothetical protein [Photorhabdus kayaii]MDB6367807.1 hypothetical protein [Photorhabdus bodei]NDL12137.1 hypothetical protein [Photorhabdus kayaii]NDL24675.1 hypothetical protein [Photorhabdus kayaii]
MSLKKTISIAPLGTVEIYSNSDIVMPSVAPTAIIKNKSMVPIRAINYWAGLIGDYQQYSHVDVYPGELKIFVGPKNLFYRYKIVVSNLSNTENAEIEFVMDPLWNKYGMPSKKVYMNSNEPFEFYSKGNAILPTDFADAIIKNNSVAYIRAVNFWAGPLGNYNMYSYVDISPGKTEILASPPNIINYYKIVFTNISNYVQNVELEVISHLLLGYDE